MAYSEKVIDHYNNPRNVGSLDKGATDVGTGLVGAPACGDVMKLQIKVGADGIIEDAKFKTFGCGSAIASSSLVTEWVRGNEREVRAEGGELGGTMRCGAYDAVLTKGSKVAAIDRVRRTVVADDGTAAPYDRLLLATGSNPFMLPVPGAQLEGVLTYRDIHDTNAMIEAAAKYRHAVVIGGGLLGLEAANGLKLRGMNVTVVHLMEWLMERQLDRTAADMLQQSLEAKGLQFKLKTETAAIVGDRDDGAAGHVKAVRFKDGTEIAAGMSSSLRSSVTRRLRGCMGAS